MWPPQDWCGSGSDVGRSTVSGTGKELRGTEEARVSGWRRWVPWVLIVLAAVIGHVASLNVWVKRQALSTDNWTNASGRLLENGEIRNAISVYVVDQLYQNVDVGKAL